MNTPTWQAIPDQSIQIERNWLFTLKRVAHRSRKTLREHDFYVMELADAVVVVAITPENKIVLVRQFRAGSGLDGLEPPGGLIDAGEDACQAAARELLEETGYAGDPPLVLGTCWANPSILTQRITTVLIPNAKPVALSKPDTHEEVELWLTPAGSIPHMIRDGRIHHALAIQGLFLWLASQIPNSPWAPLREPTSRRFQFNIQSLLIVVALSALAFASLRLLGGAGGIAALFLIAAIVPVVLWQLLDDQRGVILLRAARQTPRAFAIRLLAAVGIWFMGALLATSVAGLFRFFR